MRVSLLAGALMLTGTAMAQDTAPIGAGDRIIDPIWEGRSAVYAQNGAAATAHPLATEIAIQTLKDGGSAVDAAIAANAALGLMEPTGNGIGGDLFAIVWDPETQEVYGLNGSGRSPQSLTREKLDEALDGATAMPPYGAIPVTVPGTVDAWFAMHERWGALEMEAVLSPAISYAEEGFPLPPVIAYYWQRSIENFRDQHEQGEIEEIENAMATYAPGGEVPGVGEIFKNPDLARTYRMLAEDGRDAFYEGELAETMHDYMQRIGGYLTKQDLAEHETEFVEPISTTYRGHTVFELPPNGQGGTVLQMLNILEGYDLASMEPGSAEAIHLMVEAKRLAFEDRAAFYADPAFSPPPEGLFSKAYAAERREFISRDEAMTSVGAGDPAALEAGDTTYLVVADKDGMMVSLIQSNYRGMGTGLVPDGLGFMLQDRGQLFSLEEGHPNEYEPGKRPFHTIIPAFVTKDGKPWMAFGLMGGAMQPQGHVQILVNMIDWGMNVQAAGDAARWRHVGSSSIVGDNPPEGVGTIRVESGIARSERTELQVMGHTVEAARSGFGGYQAIRVLDNGVYAAATERRKDGSAGGY